MLEGKLGDGGQVGLHPARPKDWARSTTGEYFYKEMRNRTASYRKAVRIAKAGDARESGRAHHLCDLHHRILTAGNFFGVHH